MRLKKELDMLQRSPPPGAECWVKKGTTDELEAQILGPDGSPFEQGLFRLDIQLPDRYPFEPPEVHFKTKIYHPNVDTAGRICLDLLKMPPNGSWSPAMNLSSILMSIRLLISEPNPGTNDGMDPSSLFFII